ncbi:hypothetical protein Hte_009087 [Hypoxylon texense]
MAEPPKRFTVPLSSKAVVFSPDEDEHTDMRKRAFRACAAFNSLTPDTKLTARNCAFLMTINPQMEAGTTVGLAPTVQQPFYVDYGTCVYIHHTANIGALCTIIDTPVAPVVIGKYCVIGHNVTIVSAGPPPSGLTEERVVGGGRGAMSGSPIVIGERVWICPTATIGPGVTIGDGAIVMAGAVVQKDVPAGAEVRGNPATVIEKYLPSGYRRFPLQRIEVEYQEERDPAVEDALAGKKKDGKGPGPWDFTMGRYYGEEEKPWAEKGDEDGTF